MFIINDLGSIEIANIFQQLARLIELKFIAGI